MTDQRKVKDLAKYFGWWIQLTHPRYPSPVYDPWRVCLPFCDGNYKLFEFDDPDDTAPLITFAAYVRAAARARDVCWTQDEEQYELYWLEAAWSHPITEPVRIRGTDPTDEARAVIDCAWEVFCGH